MFVGLIILIAAGIGEPGSHSYAATIVSPTDEATKKKVAEWFDMVAAFIRRVGQDVKKQGYGVIFTDVGPESLERDGPDLFRDLIKKASGGEIQVRGFSKAAKDAAGVFRDKTTGEKGVGLWMKDFKEDGPNHFIGTGTWRESDDKWHDVRYELFQTGKQWKAR